MWPFRSFWRQLAKTCNTVTRSYFQGESPSGDAVWNIACGADHVYSISIAPQGGTKLITCRALKQIDGTECFKPLQR